ncbi:hypothetical protein DH2020_007145 [Rehmannia glutinosa]|uniref:Camphor resistance CrcB family protein n=1 Tax=Rehmannia glutinosa TaxID=99300 RepID=A0ABR0TX62_REHGL
MDHHNRELESRRSGSFGRLSGGGSSRRRSLSISQQFDDDVESESVSEAGDIGDRALHSKRISASGRSTRFSFDNVAENGIVVPIQDDNSFAVPVLENVSPVSVDAIVQSGEIKNDEKEVPWLLEYVTCLLSLAVFGILGVGSFLMGWLGVVFKGDILKVSDQLAIGLTTGFLGSLTTFSGWNQKMLDLSVEGQWVFAMLGIFLALLWGLFGSLAKNDFESGSSEAHLFLACMVGPFGVWIRWFLARFNGRGLGKNGVLKWMPFGTLAANVLAACVMAALATLKKAVRIPCSCFYLVG